jgi:Na+/glutamate symporter
MIVEAALTPSTKIAIGGALALIMAIGGAAIAFSPTATHQDVQTYLNLCVSLATTLAGALIGGPLTRARKRKRRRKDRAKAMDGAPRDGQ